MVRLKMKRVVRKRVILQKRFYDKKVIDLFDNPVNVGSLPKNDPDVGTALRGAPSCGDVLQLQIRVKDNVVNEAKFMTFGCGSAIASSELATQWMIGKTLDECLKIRNDDIAKHLSLPPIKRHCSILAEDAIRMAVKNYKEKNGVEKQLTTQ